MPCSDLFALLLEVSWTSPRISIRCPPLLSHSTVWLVPRRAWFFLSPAYPSLVVLLLVFSCIFSSWLCGSLHPFLFFFLTSDTKATPFFVLWFIPPADCRWGHLLLFLKPSRLCFTFLPFPFRGLPRLRQSPRTFFKLDDRLESFPSGFSFFRRAVAFPVVSWRPRSFRLLPIDFLPSSRSSRGRSSLIVKLISLLDGLIVFFVLEVVLAPPCSSAFLMQCLYRNFCTDKPSAS